MNRTSTEILASPIEYLKGVGPQRAAILRKELEIDTFRDLLELYPYRHLDKSRVTPISEITPDTEFVLTAGHLQNVQILGEGRSKRLVSSLRDATGTLQLIWFQGISWMEKNLKPGFRYRAFGKIGFFNGEAQLTHPELEEFDEIKTDDSPLQPIYPSTEKLKARSLGGRQIARLTQQLLSQLREKDLPEIVPFAIRTNYGLISRFQAFQSIHFPSSPQVYQQALRRLKFDEFFVSQVRTGMIKTQRQKQSRGFVFGQVGALFNNFYSNGLPFELTGAQKRVIREIRQDTCYRSSNEQTDYREMLVVVKPW